MGAWSNSQDAALTRQKRRCNSFRAHMRVISRIKSILGIGRRKTTWVWCDCGAELVDQDDNVVVNDTYTGRVSFECRECGCRSEWNFGAPTPLRLGA